MFQKRPDSTRASISLTSALGLASLGCLLMLLLRFLATGSFRYAFLPWNLFLAWVPYLLSLSIRRAAARPAIGAGVKLLLALLGLAWLSFYPNAPYILTDFIHLMRASRTVEAGPPLITAQALLWYDIVLTSAFAFIGHFIGLISLLTLHRMIQARLSRPLGWVFVVVAVGLGGFGIYIGRFERLNSWDIARAPLRTLRVALSGLFNLKAVLFSLCFALFIFLTYLVVLALYQTAQEGGPRAP